MTDRISTFVQTGKLIDNNLRLQGSYANGQVQLSSGLKSQDFEGIASDSRQLLSLQSDQKRLEAQNGNAELVQTRINLMYNSLGTIIDFGQQFAADLTAAISDIVNNTTHLQNTAQQGLTQMASTLNIEMGGRYLFSGSATATPPIDINAVGFGGAVIPSVANTNYYQGNSFVHAVEVDDNYSINYGVTADHPGVELMMRAYDLVATTPGDQATLLEAFDLMKQAVDIVSEERAAISQSSTAIEGKVFDNKEELLLLDNIITTLNEVDIAEVTVRLQEVQLQIEASYTITNKVLNLSLIDFLR